MRFFSAVGFLALVSSIAALPKPQLLGGLVGSTSDDPSGRQAKRQEGDVLGDPPQNKAKRQESEDYLCFPPCYLLQPECTPPAVSIYHSRRERLSAELEAILRA